MQFKLMQPDKLFLFQLFFLYLSTEVHVHIDKIWKNKHAYTRCVNETSVSLI